MMDNNAMQSLVKHKLFIPGVIGLVVVLAAGWKMYINHQAEKNIAQLIEDNDLDSTITYKGASAGWLADSVTLKDVVIQTGEDEDGAVRMDRLVLSGVRQSEDSDIPEAMYMQMQGMQVMIVRTDKGQAPVLVQKNLASLAGLGYTRLQGDMDVRYDYRPKDNRLTAEVGFDLEEMGKGQAEVAFDKVNLSGFGAYQKELASDSHAMLALGMMSGLRLLTETAGKTRLADFRFSMKDKGARERVLLEKREHAHFTGTLDDFSKTIADDVTKEARQEAKGSKGEMLMDFYDAISGFIKDGGTLEGKTHIERPIAIFTERDLTPSFKSLQAFLSATEFKLKH